MVSPVRQPIELRGLGDGALHVPVVVFDGEVIFTVNHDAGDLFCPKRAMLLQGLSDDLN